MRFVGVFVLVAALLGLGWVFSLPSMAECIASGRRVDPTERHCESSTGYEQLEEHALFHSRDVALGFVILVGAGFGIRYLRRRAATVAPPP